MPIARRQELLRWADEGEGRYILEDDYDSEFRFVGRPIPTLFSADRHERVIYLNTFSKTIAPSIRISYMILPPHLMAEYRSRLSFYACTVSSFEQYTLAAFMAQGRYEQHINRMRNRYRQKRDAVIDAIRTGPLAGKAEIMEQDAGLHFLLRLNTPLTDEELRRAAAEKGIRLAFLSDYYHNSAAAPQHVVVVNYSGIEPETLRRGLKRLAELWED
jgi:GntR family transcriptional regulator/MocR family aminotransferase